MKILEIKKDKRASASEITILNWNLERIKSRMVEHDGYTLAQLKDLETEYKRYLILVTRYSMDLPISSPVDEMWHTHILFTRDYEQLGRAIGCFIHHEPTTSEKLRQSLLPAYGKTLALYEKNWGKPNPAYWPPDNCVCDPEGEGTDDTGGMWDD